MERDARARASKNVPTPLSHFGVDRFAVRDQTAALSRAFKAAAADGLSLVGDPDATYRHDGRLTLSGVSFDGQGCTLLALSDGPQVLQCRGSGWRLANLRVLGGATRRSSDNAGNGVWIGGDEPDAATDFVVENVTVDGAAPGRGVATAGIMVSNAHVGRLLGVTVRRSLADGIHVTAGSSRLTIERVLIEDSGDDAVAVVSYRRQRSLCRDIRISDVVSRRSGARGLAVVGGVDVRAERLRVERSAAAGIYLFGEEAFDTYGTARCRVADAVLTGCVTGHGLAAGFRNAAVLIGGREGLDQVAGATLPRGASDCEIVGVTVAGAGAGCSAAISTGMFALRPRIAGGHVLGNAATGPAVTGMEIGGSDVVVNDVEMTNLSGLALVVLPTASGTCRVSRIKVDGSSRVTGPIQSYLYAEPAPALRQLVVSNSRFAGGPPRLSISLLPPGRLRLEHNSVR